MQQQNLIVRQLGIQPYQLVSEAMHRFTNCRTADSNDELWLVQHPSVYTQGQAGKAEHLLTTTSIPVVQSDRGGQITYHGIGQQIVYLMIDLRKRKLGVRELVTAIEQTVIQTLAHFGVDSAARSDAPGVYVDSAKICSLGLRIRKGCSFHGLALNVDMDLAPFKAINPCGYAGMQMTQLKTFIPTIAITDVSPILVDTFSQRLHYQLIEFKNWSSEDYD